MNCFPARISVARGPGNSACASHDRPQKSPRRYGAQTVPRAAPIGRAAAIVIELCPTGQTPSAARSRDCPYHAGSSADPRSLDRLLRAQVETRRALGQTELHRVPIHTRRRPLSTAIKNRKAPPCHHGFCYQMRCGGSASSSATLSDGSRSELLPRFSRDVRQLSLCGLVPAPPAIPIPSFGNAAQSRRTPRLRHYHNTGNDGETDA